MDRSYPYSRRLKSRARLRKRMVAVGAAGVVGATALFMLLWRADPISAAVTPQAQALLAFGSSAGDGQPGKLRRIYPYSVIPGGVSGQAELARVIRTDRVVATHYATFDVDKAHAVVVEKPRAVHVSYRKGGQVYWTAHKVMLAAGETLLSDGRNEMRARCANRISDLPQYPVEAHQPAMEELDQPIELGEAEQVVLGADGMPVSIDPATGRPRQTAQRFPVRGGNGFLGATPDSASADTLLASTAYSSSTASNSPVTTVGLSGSSSSMGSRPRPNDNAPLDPPATPGTPSGAEGNSGGSSGSPPPAGGTDKPAPVPDTSTTPPGGGTPIQEPAPPAKPVPDSPPPPVFTPDPLPVPGGGSTDEPPPTTPPTAPGPGPLFPEPGKQPETEPFIPQPGVTPPLDTGTEKPEPPTAVPEPDSAWLAAIGLAALAALRRRPGFIRRES